MDPTSSLHMEIRLSSADPERVKEPNSAITVQADIHGLVQDCSISNALEMLQCCTEPSVYYHWV